MRLAVSLLLLAGCGSTLDGGIHAERCATAAGAAAPLCSTGDRCNSANDCIPACTSLGCIEGACVYRAGSCTPAGCSGKSTIAGCMDCAVAAGATDALKACICSACAAECGAGPYCGGTAATTDACATCVVSALIHPGVCASNTQFQDDCFGSSSPTCRNQAQGIVACRR